MNEKPFKRRPNRPAPPLKISASAALAKAKKDCDYLRRDLRRLGFLAVDDPLWTLLVEKEKEFDAAILADNAGEGSADQ
jgi:hypothetical protein